MTHRLTLALCKTQSEFIANGLAATQQPEHKVTGYKRRQTCITGNLDQGDLEKLAPWMQAAPFKWPAHIGPSSKEVGPEYTASDRRGFWPGPGSGGPLSLIRDIARETFDMLLQASWQPAGPSCLPSSAVPAAVAVAAGPASSSVPASLG